MSLRTFKRLTTRILNNTKPLVFLCIFAYIIAQPHRFVVDDSQQNTEVVRAAYENLLDQASAPSDGSIQFETLIVGENGEATITYTVAPGDTLNSIAENFGTTTDAIIEANNLINPNNLQPGQKLVIEYDDGVMVNANETLTVEEFVRKYELNLQEFISMNYFESKSETIEEGWQIFVPLNQIEAERRGLIDKEEFVMLDLPEEKEEKKTVVAVDDKPVMQTGEVSSEEDAPSKEVTPNKDDEYQQVVISAEETQEHLENLKKQEKEAQDAAEEAKRKAEEAKRAAEEARRKAEQERTQDAEETAQQAQQQAEEAEKRAQEEEQKAQEKREQKEKELKEAVEKEDVVVCGVNQCAYNNDCRTMPENASCANEDTQQAWTCNQGFIERDGKCIKEQSLLTQSPTKETKILEQWYFNPHKVDKNVNGWGPGHCTAMAAYLWSQNFGIRIRDFWTGNAKDWLKNAANAGFTVNNTPAAGSLMVSGSGYGAWGPYGHVMYVESVDWNSGTVIVIDMNYKGRYIATKRVEAINSAKGFIHPK